MVSQTINVLDININAKINLGVHEDWATKKHVAQKLRDWLWIGNMDWATTNMPPSALPAE